MGDYSYAERDFVEAGGVFSHKRTQQRLEDARQRGIEQYDEAEKLAKASTPEYAEKTANIIKRTLAVGTVIFGFLMVLGTILGLFVLIIAEGIAIHMFLMQILSGDFWLSAFYASTLPLILIVLMFRLAELERNGTKTRVLVRKGAMGRFMDSLNSLTSRTTSRLTIADTPDDIGLKRAIGFMTLTIILMVTFGRVLEIIPEGNNALDQLIKLFTQSEVLELAGLVSMPMMTIAIILALDWLVDFLHRNFVGLTGGASLDFLSSTSSRADFIAQEQAKELERMTLELQEKTKTAN